MQTIRTDSLLRRAAAHLALALLPAVAGGQVVINEFLAGNTSVNLDPDYVNYSDWIELKNESDSPQDLGGMYLSDDLSRPRRWRFPRGTSIEPFGYLVVFADGRNTGKEALHTDFGLGLGGEQIGLFDADGGALDTLTYGPQYPDVSCARGRADGSPARQYFAAPTPGAANGPAASAHPIVSPAVAFSPAAGFYAGTQTVELATAAPRDSTEIRYTLDGSVPRPGSRLYQRGLTIRRNTVVKARAYTARALPGPVAAASFLLERPASAEAELPVFSIALDPAHLFDYDTGIYVEGATYSSTVWHSGNYYQDWERPASVEYFDPERNRAFSLGAGLRIYGGAARALPQKSIAVYLRPRYDSRALDYPLFRRRDTRTLSSFVLRNSGQDWSKTMFADAMIQQLLRGRTDIDYLEYEPCVLYLNGSYWGIHNLREKISPEYLQANHGVDPGNVDLLVIENEPRVVEGDMDAYAALTDYLLSNSPAEERAYRQLRAQLDPKQA